MGVKLAWTGLAVFVLSQAWPVVPAGNVVGAVILAIGVVVMWIETPRTG